MKTINGTGVYTPASGTTFFEQGEKVILVSSSPVRNSAHLQKHCDVDLALSYNSFPEVVAPVTDVDTPCNHKMRIPKARKKDGSLLLLATVARFKVK